MDQTTELPPLRFAIPQSLSETLLAGPSPYGHSAIASYLECPERSRLQALGVRLKYEGSEPSELGFLALGSIAHAMLAIRIVHGHEAAENYLASLRSGILQSDYLKLALWLAVYDGNYPLSMEPFDYLGVEASVITDIGDGKGNSCLRSVRYDAIVRMHTEPHGVYSLEHKTSSSSGLDAIKQYTSQFMTHVAIWNNNSSLVSKYGRMLGVIPDVLVKTKTPRAERHQPVYISPIQEERILDFLRLPNIIWQHLPVAPDGSYPRIFTHCFSRFNPCPYVSLCHDDLHSAYEIRTPVP